MSMRWSSVLIRVSLGAMTFRRSGCGFPPRSRSTFWGRSAAWSPISRNVLAPASVHAAATASTNTSGNRRPRGLRGSGTRASTASRPGTFPAPFLITLVTAVMRACDTVPAAFRSGLARLRHP